MNDIHLEDLANPVLDDLQQSIIDYGNTLDIHFDPDAILKEASEALNLDDFGPNDFRERLDLICQEWEADDGLQGIGRYSLYQRLLRYSKMRLLIQDTLVHHPEIHDIEIKQPVIVIGLPRTGTTHLLNLLAADSRFRSLPLWESYEPVPTPGEALLEGGVDPRYKRCNDEWEALRGTVPHLAAMHPLNPDHINEEIELMLPNFSSYCFEWFSHSPKFRDHYLAMDQQPHYDYMKTVLKVMQFLQPDSEPTRWVLKSPMHLENIPELKNSFPDATFVVTHRDPVSVIQSTITMLAYGQRMNRKSVLTTELASYWTDRVKRLLTRCMETRDVLSPDESLDVLFHEFMQDDMAIIEQIYDKANIELTPTARAEMQAFVDAHPRGKHGKMKYHLEKHFNVNPDELREQFRFYFDRFPIKAETS